MRAYLSFVVLYLLAACQSLPQPIDTKKTYQQDMVVEVNGVKGEGAFVVPSSQSYAIRIDVRGGIDLMVVKTCNREIKIDKPVKSGWFSRRGRMEFDFVPNQREKDAACPLELQALNESGKNSFALVAFESVKYNLSANLECNGASIVSRGTSVCQSRAGLRQIISFPVEVHQGVASGNCGLSEKVEGKELSFILKPGFCNYLFMEKNPPYKKHRFYTIGYEDFIVKGLEQP